MTQLELTENQTVFEYADTLDDYRIPYHPGFILISEIALYQQFRFETVITETRIIQNICDILYIDIHGGDFRWIDYDIYTMYTEPIFATIISRLKCITNEYNEFDNFVEYVQQTRATVRFNYLNDEEYQSRLSYYIIYYFITMIGENETAKIFAKHYGDIVNYLFYQQY